MCQKLLVYQDSWWVVLDNVLHDIDREFESRVFNNGKNVLVSIVGLSTRTLTTSWEYIWGIGTVSSSAHLFIRDTTSSIKALLSECSV